LLEFTGLFPLLRRRHTHPPALPAAAAIPAAWSDQAVARILVRARSQETSMTRTTLRRSAPPLYGLLPPFASLLIICTSPAAALADDNLTPRLEKGEIIATTVPGSGVRAGRAVALVDAPPRVLRDLLAGFGDYQSFVPRITASRILKGNRFVVECDMPWPVNRTWVYGQFNAGSRDGAEVVTWKMLNGTLKSYEGAAWIQPYGKGRSLVTYQMVAVPHIVAPDALMNLGLRSAAEGMVEALRNKAAKVLAANPGLRVAAEASRTH
jgi:ribosome-associated toxin RatA of RatAB toxin-antitoxin module